MTGGWVEATRSTARARPARFLADTVLTAEPTLSGVAWAARRHSDGWEPVQKLARGSPRAQARLLHHQRPDRAGQTSLSASCSGSTEATSACAQRCRTH